MAGPLAGAVRVLDLSERSPAAAIAGMVLADLGAEVIRVEPEGGDPLRVLAGAQVWMRGQQSVTVTAADMRDDGWDALRDSADVIIDTAQPFWNRRRFYSTGPRVAIEAVISTMTEQGDQNDDGNRYAEQEKQN